MGTVTNYFDIRCDHSNGERPRYYARQLITADDMTLEQDYFRSKLRLHNRMLHGCGIVCGAAVKNVSKEGDSIQSEPWKVLIEPGYILGPYGDEIVIDCERKFDLRTESLIGVTGEPCVEEADPWCVDAHEAQVSGPFYLVVRYKEVMTRPVRAHPTGCSCDDTNCEYSRLRDGYEIKALRGLPTTPPEPARPSACPVCPTSPWVLLAGITVGNDGIPRIGLALRQEIKPPVSRASANSLEQRQVPTSILSSETHLADKSGPEQIEMSSSPSTVQAEAKNLTPSKKKRK